MDEKMLKAMVRDFATKEREPIAAQIDEEATFPAESIKKMAELGLMARGALYLHCIWGVDRTGATVARARCEVQGWSAADAFGELRAYGFAFQLKRRRLERYHREVLAYFGFRLSGYAPLTPDHPDHVACRVREATYIGDPDD